MTRNGVLKRQLGEWQTERSENDQERVVIESREQGFKKKEAANIHSVN